MDRTTLAAIIDAIDGAARTDHTYAIPESRRLAIHIGDPGSALVISTVTRCKLGEKHVEALSHDQGDVFYFAYDDVCALHCRPSKDSPTKRTGFA